MRPIDMPKVCLVTGELYPFTAGGIGRLTYNLIVDGLRRRAPVEFHLLVPCWSELEKHVVEATFGGRVVFHKAKGLDSPEHSARFGHAYPPRWAFTDTPYHADSLELMLELKHLEQQGTQFDVVEFPDYLGWAFCSLQERRLGLAFASTRIGVRLHSTDGLIRHHEDVPPTVQSLATHELERRSLQEADVVVAHLEAIADENQRFYAFDDQWRQAVKLEFPPVSGSAVTAPEGPVVLDPDLVFITKVQRCKRPDLFVKGAAVFFQRNPAYRGRAVLACHVPSVEYGEKIRSMVPAAMADRFSFVGPQPREALMRSGVVVIPSDYESLNLSAYEASELGATLVLNRACPAFAPGSPFVDQENCYLFDGTPENLATVLERATRQKPPKRAQRVPAVPYFESRFSVRRPKPAVVGARVSVLITNHNLGAYLQHALESVAASTHDRVEVVIVDDASTNTLDAEILSTIEREATDLPIKVIRNSVNRGLPASRNIGLRHCTGEFVLPLDADDRISPRFLEVAVRALTNNPEYGVVVPTTAYFTTEAELEARKYADYACFLGNAPTLGMVANRFSCATSLVRRSLFDQFRYDEKLDSYEDWSLYLRMAHAGVRFLVTNEIQFHYRRREGSMVRGVDPTRHRQLLARMYASLPVPLSRAAQLSGLVALQGTPPPPPPPPEQGAASIETPVPIRYRVADAANSLVKRSPGVHQSIRDNLVPLAATERRPLRYEVADRIVETALRLVPLRSWRRN